MDNQQALKLLARFAPTVHFHPDETSFPVSYETYLTYSSLNAKLKNGGKLKLAKTTNSTLLTEKVLCRLLDENNTRLNEVSSFFLEPNIPVLNQLAKPQATHFNFPVHGEVAEVMLEVNGNKIPAYRLSYAIVYPENNPDFVFGLGRKYKFAGYHKGDIEHISIYVRKEPEIIDSIYYAAHSMTEGQWIKNQKFYQDGKVCWELNQKPELYIGKGSHAAYYSLQVGVSFFDKKAAWIPRVVGFATDKIGSGYIGTIREKDIFQMPETLCHNQLNHDDQSICLYAGGEDQLTVEKDFTMHDEPECSSNGFIRLAPTERMFNWFKHRDHQIDRSVGVNGLKVEWPQIDDSTISQKGFVLRLV